MDKNEYNLRLEEINRYVDQGSYDEAAQVADTIEWKRVRNTRTLLLISEVYEAVGRLEDSKDMLLKVYRRSPVGKSVLYRLVEVTIGLKQFDEAIEYYSEYIQAAPHDNNRFILKYKIYKGRGSSVDEQIEILKEYLDQEYNEKYAYELAKLYQQADRIQECLAACDDLVLWFQSGHYVLKALELKKRYASLTPKQRDIYERELAREESGDEEEEIGQEKQMVDVEDATAADHIMEDAARQIAESVKDSVAEGQSGESAEDEAAAPTVVIDTQAVREARDENEEAAEQAQAAYDEEQASGEEPADANAYEADEAEEEPAYAPEEEPAYEPEEEPEEEPEDLIPSGRAVNYDPENLQSEVAQSMREIISGVGRRDDVDPDEEVVDRVIEESKKEQEAAMASREDSLRVRMSNRLKMPGRQGRTSAGKLSIDDVLLSMGEKGTAVRQAVAKAGTPKGTQPEGVLSAVDEALLNMGVTPEHLARDTADTKPTAQPDVMTELSFLQRPEEELQTSERGEEETELQQSDALLESLERDTEELPGAQALEEAVADSQELPAEEELMKAAEKTQILPSREELAAAAAAEAEKTQVLPSREELAAAAAETEKTQVLPGREELAAAAAAEAEKTQILPARKELAAYSDVDDALLLDDAEDTFADDAEAGSDTEDTVELPAEDAREEEQSEPEPDDDSEAGEVAQGDTEDAEPEAYDTEEDYAEETSEEDKTAEDDTKEAEAEPEAVEDMSMDDIINARTRRLPRKEIEKQLQENAKSGKQPEGTIRKNMQPRKARRMLPASVRSYFDGFYQVPDLEMQISLALSGAMAKGKDRTSRTGNILVFGGHGSGKTTLAVSLAKSIAQLQGREFVKMAKIYATDLNRKDIAATIAKIAGGILIIEEAGDLEDAIADQLTTAMEFRTDGLVIIMEDEEKYLRSLLMRHPRLTMKFTTQIYLPHYTVDDYIGFAQNMAAEQECILSEEAEDALAADIEAEQQKGTQISLIDIRETVEAAVKRAGKLSRRVFGGRKRYDEYGRIILRGKDIR